MRQTIYEGRILSLYIDDGKWEYVKHAPAVVILAIQDGKMLAVKQKRRAAGVDTIEAPAGLVDEGEDPIVAAARELGEEARLAADFTLLGRFYTSPGFTDELIHLYRADNLREGSGNRDEDEHDMEVIWIEPQCLLDGVQDGSIHTSGPTVSAALHAILELGKQQG